MEETSLKIKLLQLECHFTWGLKKRDIDLYDVQIQMEKEIKSDMENKERICQAFTFLAYIKHLNDSPEEALAHLKEAEEVLKEHSDERCEKLLTVTYGNFAWLHYHMGEYSKSQSYLDKLEAAKQKLSVESLATFFNGVKGWTFLNFPRDYDKAKEYFQEALKVEPGEISWNVGYAVALYRTESEILKSVEESPTIEQLRIALKIDPENVLIMVLLGLKLVRYKNLPEATELVEKALELSPDSPHVTKYAAKFYRQNGCLDKSVAILKRALEQDPQSAFMHHQIALCYKSKKISLHRDGGHKVHGAEIEELINQAIHHLEEAILWKPCFIYARLELALFYAEKKYTSEAKEQLDRALKLATDKNECLQTVHLYYGDFHWYHNKSQSLAIEHYMEGSKIQQNPFETKKCVDKLEAIAEMRISKNFQDGEAFGILGYVHQKRDEKRLASESYKKALSIDHGNADYLTALSDLQLSLH